MLRLIAEKCTDVLLRHGTIQDNQKAIYLYGFELFWSLALSGLSILVLGAVFHYFPLAVTFLVYFVPIRIPAGGFHASSYKNCFLATNLMAVACVTFSKWLYQVLEAEYVLWGALFAAFFYIWFKAPAKSKKHSMKKDRIIRNRKCARQLLAFDVVSLLILRLVINGCVVYTAIVALCAVALMILITQKGGE